MDQETDLSFCPLFNTFFLHCLAAGSWDTGSSPHLDQIVPGPTSPVTCYLTMYQGSPSFVLKCHVAGDG